eukprot:7784138-Pyramimonas_sp.AAC.1
MKVGGTPWATVDVTNMFPNPSLRYCLFRFLAPGLATPLRASTFDSTLSLIVLKPRNGLQRQNTSKSANTCLKTSGT